MTNLFLIISGIIGLILILIILFQKTEGGSLGLGTQTNPMSGSNFGKSNNSGFTKTTYIIGFIFLFWCLIASSIISKRNKVDFDISESSENIEIDDDLTNAIPEVPNE